MVGLSGQSPARHAALQAAWAWSRRRCPQSCTLAVHVSPVRRIPRCVLPACVTPAMHRRLSSVAVVCARPGRSGRERRAVVRKPAHRGPRGGSRTAAGQRHPAGEGAGGGAGDPGRHRGRPLGARLGPSGPAHRGAGPGRRRLGKDGTLVAALLQATSLPFLVTATQIGLSIGAIRPITAAAFVSAGLLSVVIFPPVALARLRRALTVHRQGTSSPRPGQADGRPPFAPPPNPGQDSCPAAVTGGAAGGTE